MKPIPLFRLWMLFFGGLCWFVFVVPLGRTEDPPNLAIPLGKIHQDLAEQGPYCGIYCIKAALQTLGIDAPFAELGQPKYLGSYKGSSLGELIRALNDYTAKATPLKGLTPAGLVALETPCILHVRRDGTTESYGHWLLFLGQKEGKAHLFNPPNGEEYLPMEELLYLWDGVGLAVYAEDPSPWTVWRVRGIQLLDSLYLVGMGFLSVWVVFQFLPQGVALSVLGFGLRLLLSVGFCLVLANLFSMDSLSDRWDLYAAISRSKDKPSFDPITAEELQGRLDDSSVVLVDARFGPDFKWGHIPGAISLPIDCGPGQARAVAKQLGTTETVIYCQSDGCGWSEVIAKTLHLRGVGPIRIFKGGYAQWKQLKNPVTKRDLS